MYTFLYCVITNISNTMQNQNKIYCSDIYDVWNLCCTAPSTCKIIAFGCAQTIIIALLFFINLNPHS